jgi:hypothetical protein
LQTDPAVRFSVEALEGGRLSGEHGNHRFPRRGIVPALDEHQVAVPNRIFDHRVAANTEDIDVATGRNELLEREHLGHLENIDRGTGGDQTKDPQTGSRALVLADDLESAADARSRAPEASLALELGHMAKDRDLVQAEMPRDLLERGADPLGRAVLLEEMEDVALPTGQGRMGAQGSDQERGGDESDEEQVGQELGAKGRAVGEPGDHLHSLEPGGTGLLGLRREAWGGVPPAGTRTRP